ncbi:P-loop containing nucleoside triphosphate hydrolase protein [Fimicolochytrium jonesii]|uniref:P-loop containing nucleoside triphosphate hydrolase protein n=1 Tax=Fimicolochytrium jonesii TaxID=1396493 RepID=UPI0022FF2CB0|nr:P-loop containing nucleoside triphosphate hydrolase protein [Fimicolochytrium jonesii]KAI8817023.1 P-loop containing nucleoside triphosphate hydrolase protein [Fimicolochytrium jonesii]
MLGGDRHSYDEGADEHDTASEDEVSKAKIIFPLGTAGITIDDFLAAFDAGRFNNQGYIGIYMEISQSGNRDVLHASAAIKLQGDFCAGIRCLREVYHNAPEHKANVKNVLRNLGRESTKEAFEDYLKTLKIRKAVADVALEDFCELLFAVTTFFVGALGAGKVMSTVFAGLGLTYSLTLAANVYLYMWSFVSLEPSTGAIEFSNVEVSYASRPTPALENLSLHVPGGRHIGIVGRTGSGKSTLVSVRKTVVVIAQEPVLFAGTLRDNLDARGEFDDAQLWRALEDCGIKQLFGDQMASLNTKVEAQVRISVWGSVSSSVLPRLFSQSPILVVDESTAALDPSIEQRLRTLLDSGLPPTTTIISIAHRIEALPSMHRVIVLANSAVVEDGTPFRLLSDPDSAFYGLAVEAARGEAGLDVFRVDAFGRPV